MDCTLRHARRTQSSSSSTARGVSRPLSPFALRRMTKRRAHPRLAPCCAAMGSYIAVSSPFLRISRIDCELITVAAHLLSLLPHLDPIHLLTAERDQEHRAHLRKHCPLGQLAQRRLPEDRPHRVPVSAACPPGARAQSGSCNEPSWLLVFPMGTLTRFSFSSDYPPQDKCVLRAAPFPRPLLS